MSLLSPQLQAFIAVVKHKTVHAAAESLSLTQTAVTQRIRTLEQSLKSTLFIRSRRGMEPTREAEALWRYCLAAKELEGEVLAQIQDAGLAQEVELTIAGPSSMMHSRILPACMATMKTYPNLLLHFNVADTQDRHQLLKSGQCDFAVIEKTQMASQMQIKALQPEEYVLVCSQHWQGRTLDDIIKNERIIDFNEQDQMTFQYLNQFNLLEKANQSRYFVNRTDNMALLVANELGYTALAKEFAHTYIETNQLMVLNEHKVYRHESLLAWYARPEPPAYFQAILNSIS